MNTLTEITIPTPSTCDIHYCENGLPYYGQPEPGWYIFTGDPEDPHIIGPFVTRPEAEQHCAK